MLASLEGHLRQVESFATHGEVKQLDRGKIVYGHWDRHDGKIGMDIDVASLHRLLNQYIALNHEASGVSLLNDARITI